MAERYSRSPRLVTGCRLHCLERRRPAARRRPRRGRHRQHQRRLRPAPQAMAARTIAAAPRISISIDSTSPISRPSSRSSPRSTANRRSPRSSTLPQEPACAPSVANPWVYFQANCDGTLNLLDLCRRSGVRKFLLASTSSLYGLHNTSPYREDADTNRPLSPYAASKKAAEAIAYSLPPPARHRRFDSPLFHRLRTGRPARHERLSVHPPHCRGRVDRRLWRRFAEPRFHLCRRHRPRHRRRAQSRWAMKSSTLAATAKCGSRRVIDEIARLLGKKPKIEYRPMHPADVPSTRADVSKAARLLGWRPQISIEEGLRRSVEWYFANRDMARSLELCDRTE